MKRLKLSDFLLSFFQAFAVTLYCAGVIAFVNFMGRNSPVTGNDLAGGILMLLLFIISALVTGSIVLGYPAYLAFNKEYRRAIKLVSGTTLWLMVFFGVALLSVWLALHLC